MTQISFTIFPRDATVHLVKYKGDAIAVLQKGPACRGLVPFDLSSCEMLELEVDSVKPCTILLKEHIWKLQLKCIVSLNCSSEKHWLFLSAPRDDKLEDGSLSFTENNLQLMQAGLEFFLANYLSLGPKAYRLFVMSEPKISKELSMNSFGITNGPMLHDTPIQIHERVLFADTCTQISSMLLDFLTEFFLRKQTKPTTVVWPPCLPFPVNAHTNNQALRQAEHEMLLLPPQGMLRINEQIEIWETAADLPRPRIRASEAEQQCMVSNPHTGLKKGPSPAVEGAIVHIVSGTYDYYHYCCDGFVDNGWGCAYRSLQTILSWFRHQCYFSQPVPSIQSLQKILSVIDPDKFSKSNFVGSNEWIGSIEIMLVLGHFMPGLECTIKHLESGSELDTDASLQLFLLEHFKSEKSPPVMIGGGSYAQTILGICANVDKAEALYLILDPHYSANPTDLKTAVNKGYVGWKQARKFLSSTSWYNICIPRVHLYDPR